MAFDTQIPELFRTWLMLRDLRAGTTRSPDALRETQDLLLRDTVAHAARNVRFYRRFWADAGFDAAAFGGLEDLGQIPILPSAYLKSLPEEERPLDAGFDRSRATYLDTSGSSGNKLRIWKSPDEERARRAVGLRIWFEHGFRWHHMTAQFQIAIGPSLFLQRLGISRKVWISTALPIETQRQQLLQSKADVIVGTPTALRRMAYALSDRGLKPKTPTVIFGAGELLDTETTTIVEEVFGVAPVGVYGQTEVGFMAWQCTHRQGFHLNADTHIVEVLADGKPAEPGEIGRIVVTDLHARTMPFIRYDTGDYAVLADGLCACGRTLPLLASIEGRATEMFTTPSGARLTMKSVINHAAKVLRLGSYRLHQKSIGRFLLELAPDGLMGNTQEPDALQHLRRLLGDVEIEVRHVPPFEPTGTGKTKSLSVEPSIVETAVKNGRAVPKHESN